VQFPDTPRPYKSWFGIYGAVMVIVACCFFMTTQLWSDPNFRISLLSYAIKYFLFGLYYVVDGRRNMMPTEDALIYSILKGGCVALSHLLLLFIDILTC
jgi:amino acid permease